MTRLIKKPKRLIILKPQHQKLTRNKMLRLQNHHKHFGYYSSSLLYFFFIFTKHYLRILISALAISSLKVNLKTRIKIRTLEELTRHKFHLLPIPNLNQHISQDIKTTLLKKGLY